MRKSRILSAFMVLGLMVAGVVAVSPAPVAQATTSSQVISQPNLVANEIMAHEDGSFTALGCDYGGAPNLRSVHFDSTGTERSTVGLSQSNGTCYSQSYNVLENGTVYLTETSSGYSKFTAWKNGRKLWEADTSSTTNCATGSWTSKDLYARAVAEGKNGNIFAVFNSQYTPFHCPARLMAFEPDGTVIFNVSVQDNPVDSMNWPRLWVYDNEIIVVNGEGQIRYFDIDTGAEDVLDRYSIGGYGEYLPQVTADEEGNVYAMLQGGSWSPNPRLRYHMRDGDSGEIVDTYVAYGVHTIQATGPGELIAVNIDSETVERFDIANEAVDDVAFSLHTGGKMIGYTEDTDGTQLIVEEYTNSSTERVLEIREFNPATSTTNILETVVLSGTTTYYPYRYYDGLSSAVGGGFVYLQVCESSVSTCGNWTAAPPQNIYKVALRDFGTVIKNDYKRNSYES